MRQIFGGKRLVRLKLEAREHISYLAHRREVLALLADPKATRFDYFVEHSHDGFPYSESWEFVELRGTK